MNDVLVPFQKVLDTLLDESKEITRRYLTEFSDIEPASLQSLQETWPRIELNRKLLLLDQLNALANVDTLVSFDDLGRALLRDDEPQVRIRAMRLLVECEDPRLVPIYIDLLTNDEVVSVRAEAASTLGIFVQLGEFDDIPDDLFAAVPLMAVVDTQPADAQDSEKDNTNGDDAGEENLHSDGEPATSGAD